ncbi:MAG: YdbH domain-containing protein [Alphaproteobacteria bacterium]|nr:YdbH domain-containing protein [Alphaproteobacteria bacterium]
MLADLRVNAPGADDGPRAARLVVTYDPTDLLSGKVETLEIDGLRAAIDLTAPGRPRIAGLPDDLLVPGESGAPSPPPPLPRRITLSDLALDAETPIGPRRLTGALSIDRPDQQALLPFEAAVDLADAAGSARLALAVSMDPRRVVARGDGALDLAAWSGALPGVSAAEGRLVFSLDASGRAEALSNGAATPAALLAAIEGRLALTPTGLSLETSALGPIALADAPLALTAADGALTLSAPEGSSVRWIAPPLPEVLGAIASSEMRQAGIILNAPAEFGATVTAAHDGGWEIAANRSVHLMNGPVSLDFQPTMNTTADGHLTILLAADAQLRAPRLRLGAGLRLRRPLVLTARAPVTLEFAEGALTRLFAPLATRDLAATLPAGEEVDLFLPALDVTWVDDALSIEARAAALRLPEEEIRLTDLDARVEGPTEAPYAVSLRAGENSRDGLPVILGAASLDASVSADPDGGWRADGRLSAVDGHMTGRFDARLPVDGPSALRFETDPVRYAPEGFQPGRISPLLTGLFRQVSGALSLKGDLTLGDDRASEGDVTVTLDGIGFAAGLARVIDLSGAVVFDAARPPATEPRQSLQARLAVAGLPAAQTRLVFALDEQARLLIERFALDMLGGEIALVDALFDPLANRFSGSVELSSVDLDDAFLALDVDGVDGEGELHGVIPLRLETANASATGALVVDGARIAAADPGRLQVDHPAVSAYLGGRNEAVDLLVDALKNFHFDELSATLDVGPDGTGVLGVKLLGANPNVLDGQPFDLNISIETDFAKLFGALGDAVAVTDELLERLAEQTR